MKTESVLEGTIRKEGNLVIGKGEAGMQIYDDTMQLAITKSAKTGYVVRTVISASVAAALAWLACKYDNLYLAAGSGATAAITVQQGRRAVKACKKYAQTLSEVVSHGWNSKEELKKIDDRYL
ncbi:MAG: hypothetical protein V3V78_04605 [Candidatus Woesearchaeota archaeon]